MKRGVVSKAHRRAAFAHAKKHVLEEIDSIFGDALAEEHHSVIKASDGTDLHDEVMFHFERWARRVRRMVRSTSFREADRQGFR